MVQKGIFWNTVQDFFEFTQIGCTGDFPAIGLAEDKISKSQLIHKKLVDLGMQAG